MNWLKYLVGLAAIIIAASAAYFSISGLSKLFAGATLAVVIMASALEFAKLVAATYLKQKWNLIQGFNKFYLSLAVVILMLITSAGIYGFLTSAYQTTSDQLSIIEQQISIPTLKKQRYQEQLENYSQERNSLSTSVSELSKGLSNNVIQYTDTAGNIVKTTSGATRRALEGQLNDMKSQRDIVTSKIDVLNDSVTNLDLQILDIHSNNTLAAEVGPLRYMSNLTGASMDKVVNYFALCIVLVFDPLAIALIIAFNGLIIEEKKTNAKKINIAPPAEMYEVYGEKANSQPEKEQPPTDAETFSHLNNEKEYEFINEPEPTVVPVEKEIVIPKTVEPMPQQTTVHDEQQNVVPPIHNNQRHEDPYVEMRTPSSIKEPILINDTEDTSDWITNPNPELDYHHPKFDWSIKANWINNPEAVNYWLRHKRPSQEEYDNMIKKY